LYSGGSDGSDGDVEGDVAGIDIIHANVEVAAWSLSTSVGSHGNLAGCNGEYVGSSENVG
jgi:ribosomal protein L18E